MEETQTIDSTKSVCELVRTAEQNYITGTTTISKYVEFSQYENIEKIDAYLNSKHISGEYDSMGREKPFFNIVTAAVNIWYRATDIDRKNIRIKATKRTDILGAFLATIHLQEWMRREAFGQFLNEWGRALAKYGSAVCKFVEADGMLHSSVIPWNRLITDTVDFYAAPVIEKLYYTPAQLKAQKGYDKKVVKDLLRNRTIRKDLAKQNRDVKDDYIEVYEIHGELPLSLLTDREEDDDTYVQQMHVISFQAKKDNDEEYDDYSLYKGRESKSPYMITSLIKEDGRAQSIGAVEYLFDTQWMKNHTVKAIKDQLDLASKLIFQTADPNFVGQNVLNAIETGDILVHSANNPLTQLQNNSHDISSLVTLGDMFAINGQKITGATDAIAGNNFPSGTPYSQVALLNQESHDLFELMTENKGLHIEEMCRKFIIPYLKKQMDTADEIATTLEAHDLQKVDSLYIPNEATRRGNRKMAEQMFAYLEDRSAPVAQLPNYQAEQEQVKSELAPLGNQRFFIPSDFSDQTWKDAFLNLEWEVEVEVTNETSDKDAVLKTLTTVLQVIATNPAVLSDPNMKMLFNKIVEMTGVVSSIEISQASNSPTPTNLPNMNGMAEGNLQTTNNK